MHRRSVCEQYFIDRLSMILGELALRAIIDEDVGAFDLL
jgi:hypothetical protein